MFVGTGLLLAYLLTVSSELICVSFFKIRPLFLTVSAVILVNSFTHPLFVGYGMYIFGMPWIAAEVSIVFVEALAYRFLLEQSLKQAFLISLLANATSIIAGAILWDLYL